LYQEVLVFQLSIQDGGAPEELYIFSDSKDLVGLGIHSSTTDYCDQAMTEYFFGDQLNEISNV
jgi:hypothetical protein